MSDSADFASTQTVLGFMGLGNERSRISGPLPNCSLLGHSNVDHINRARPQVWNPDLTTTKAS
jgi:hypothetical protein